MKERLKHSIGKISVLLPSLVFFGIAILKTHIKESIYLSIVLIFHILASAFSYRGYQQF